MRKFAAGLVLGLIIGAPTAAEASTTWRKYYGYQTGEVLLCRVKDGIEKDVHGKWLFVHCDGKPWGRPRK